MLGEKEIKALLREHGIRPNKLLGQNFLVDKNMHHKILKSCELAKDDVVLEVGAGLGALTFDIAQNVKKVFAVEKDRVLSKILKERAGDYSNLKIIPCDMLKVGMKEIFENRKIKVIGNLPYYITSPLMSYMIENRESFDSIFITVQKEVAMRFVADCGSKDYSPISLYVQFYTQPCVIFSISKGVFYPKPDVDSCFVKLDILESPPVDVKSKELFFKIVRTAFSQRRKTILNSLGSKSALHIEKQHLQELLESIDIDPMSRAEGLSLEDFAAIANSM